uniref:Triple functional domain protein-like n=1 Tax=Diabrotica virgifera virgifera TaxID=50390 RepID=A0A6P7GIC6_DIAVI
MENNVTTMQSNIQYQQNVSQTYSLTTTSKVQFSSKEKAIIFNALDNTKLQEYLIPLGNIIQPKNIIFCSRLSNNRICMYLSSKQLVEDYMTNRGYIEIQGEIVRARKLITPAERIVLSNVCPSIPHEILINELQNIDLVPASPMTFLKISATLPKYNHILSFRSLDNAISQQTHTLSKAISHVPSNADSQHVHQLSEEPMLASHDSNTTITITNIAQESNSHKRTVDDITSPEIESSSAECNLFLEPKIRQKIKKTKPVSTESSSNSVSLLLEPTKRFIENHSPSFVLDYNQLDMLLTNITGSADPLSIIQEYTKDYVSVTDIFTKKVEEFYSDCDVTLKELDELYQYVMASKMLRPSQVQEAINTSSDMAESTKMLVFNATETGKELVENIEYDSRTRKFASESFDTSTSQDTLDTIKTIDEIIIRIKNKQLQIEDAWIEMEKVYIDTKDLGYLEEGIVKVINWILGPAENLLNSHQKVGYDVLSAEDLRREHEGIELGCWETYGTYAELINKINSFADNEFLSLQHKDLISQKDFMDFVCKSFAMRLERRRNILITSLRFYRLVSEYFDRTAEVFDTLVMGTKITEFDTAGEKLKQLEENQISLDHVEAELRKEGEKLQDMLSMSVKDCLGREIPVDYSEDIVNIRDVLDATVARKNIFSDSVELQKLTLKQVTHIDSYERDTVQAVRWLDELLRVMLRDHGHVGCTVYEIQRQKDEHVTFQETAKGTYNYGCQLLNASLVLRQSCKLALDDHANLYQRLKSSWQKLLHVSQEQMTRLRVSAVFHRSVEEQCNQLRDLREAVATIPLMDLARKKTRVDYYFGKREKLIVEVGRMVRLGKMLRSRLKEPLCFGE